MSYRNSIQGALLAVLVGGCATLPAAVESRVQRADSMGQLDQLGDELGADDWQIATVVPIGGTGAFMVVFERRTPRWNVALMKKRGLAT